MDSELEECAQFIEQLSYGDVININSDMADAIDRLWKSEPIQLTFEHKKTLTIVHSCAHFFDDIKRLAHPDYLPSEDVCSLASLHHLAVSVHEKLKLTVWYKGARYIYH